VVTVGSRREGFLLFLLCIGWRDVWRICAFLFRESFGGRRSEGAPNAPSATLFVGNLSFTSTEDSLYEAFADYNPQRVRIITDRDTGKMKGFGYLEFGSVEDATKVCCRVV
jgi:RNA recognition motif-containing protein